METIHPIATIVDTISDIKNNVVMPVVIIQETSYLVDISREQAGTLIWTEFDKYGEPVVSYQGRYSSYHRFIQLFRGPTPKSKYDTPVHKRLPLPPTILTVPQVLAGYKD